MVYFEKKSVSPIFLLWFQVRSMRTTNQPNLQNRGFTCSIQNRGRLSIINFNYCPTGNPDSKLEVMPLRTSRNQSQFAGSIGTWFRYNKWIRQAELASLLRQSTRRSLISFVINLKNMHRFSCVTSV